MEERSGIRSPKSGDRREKSYTSRRAGCLMSGAASKAVDRHVRYASLPDATRTPQGFTLNSRGQGHAFGARRPRIASPTADPTLKGSNQGAAPPGPTAFYLHRNRGFHPRLLTVLPFGEHGTVKPPRVSLVEPVAYRRDSYEF